MKEKVIYVCSENHHWIDDGLCPFCNKQHVKTFDYQPGDCIKCGCLCPEYAYGCTSPAPIEFDE